MEEDVCYSTVTFNASDNEKHEEKEVVIPISPSYRKATVCLGLLCFLLLSALTAISIFNYIHMSQYNTILVQFTKERAANQELLADKAALNNILDFISKQSTFLVNEYCQSTGNGVQCKPCPQNWIQNGSNCYYFHLQDDPSWRTWWNSEEFCQRFGAHLAIIDNMEEQEFINKHIKPYFDQYHGYWIGLHEKSEQPKIWVWTSGAKLEGGFWIDAPSQSDNNCVLSMVNNSTLNSWHAERCLMFNRWICKMTVLTWPNFLQAQMNHSNLSTF
ncbi:C-type lectin domain family 9 member A isoform X2 [Myxocyprinus asiaticus]|uniref:C-type lectin domain family 9 member A isoform X2 n=1 Tax=Myxocyprinus asiaticus TaxID=70543 RepID=UPI002223BBBA|nr:C-type lectin domain family 9 member A isoform X2 [Myxocyprinus asiaticus]